LCGSSPSAQGRFGGCLSRWPYISTVPISVLDVAATSMKITGVRPSSSCTSTVSDGISAFCAFDQSTSSFTAAVCASCLPST